MAEWPTLWLGLRESRAQSSKEWQGGWWLRRGQWEAVPSFHPTGPARKVSADVGQGMPSSNVESWTESSVRSRVE